MKHKEVIIPKEAIYPDKPTQPTQKPKSMNPAEIKKNAGDPKAWNDAVEAFIKDLKFREQELNLGIEILQAKSAAVQKLREDLELFFYERGLIS